MKVVYIAHPIGGDVESNLADLRRIIRRINLECPGVVPFAPYYSDVVSMDDSVASERSRGIQNDMEILQSGIVHELWLTGDRISSGMQAEKAVAELLGITVLNKINEL